MSRHTHQCTGMFLQHAIFHSASLKFLCHFPCCLPTSSPLPAACQPVFSSVFSLSSQLLQFPIVLKYFAPASELTAHCFSRFHRGSHSLQPSLFMCSCGRRTAGHHWQLPSRAFSQIPSAGFPSQSYFVTDLFLDFFLILLNLYIS